MLLRCHAVATREVGTGAEHRDDAGVRIDDGVACGEDLFNLQAATRIAANDRAGLERMARYLARPPIATDRLSRLDDGRLALQLKRPWRDGTTAFVLTPHELIERLVALVPRPRATSRGTLASSPRPSPPATPSCRRV